MIKFLQKISVQTVIATWSTYYFAEILTKPSSAQVLIRPVYFFIMIVYFFVCYADYKELKKQSGEKASPGLGKNKKTLATLLCLGGTALYVLSMPFLGFPLSTTLYLSLSFFALGTKRKVLAVIAAIFFTVALYYIFKTFLGVPLPLGIIGKLV